MPKSRRTSLRRLLLAIVVLFLLIVAGAWATLRASLPKLDGQLNTAGLNAPVTIARDALGVVSISGASRRDVSFAMGFVHAQERYFEMDLMRRAAAGELSELVGAAALPMDKQRRPFRMRARAEKILAASVSEDRTELSAYCAGVNAGLAALDSRPWEYWVLGAPPRAWSEADSILVLDAMFFDLNDSTNARELAFAKIRSALPESVYKFLSASGGPWDAPLLGPAMKYPSLPPEADLDLRKVDAKLLRVPAPPSEPGNTTGSNSFAVEGSLTATHAALVSNDMHLNLRVPNIWFRARLGYPSLRHAGAGAGKDRVDLIGVTLPGVPALVGGSNRHVAWAFTNSYGDWLDWVRVNLDPADPSQYRDASGMRKLDLSEEVIKVHNAPDEKLQLRDTQWGPILGADADGTPLALAWTALQPDAVNLEMLHLDSADSVDEAIEIANRSGLPPQNFVVGDRAGNIGWTIAGRIPRREGGYDPLLPSDWSQPGTGWNGWVQPNEYPRLPNPPAQRIWTANTRTLDFESADFAHVGDGGYDLGARARQIRDDLKSRTRFAPDDMLAIELDDRALFLAHWHDVLTGVLKNADNPALAQMKKYAADWNGRADPASVGYRLARNFRREVTDTIMDGFAAAVRVKFDDFKLPPLSQAETLVDAILAQKPAYLLPPGYTSWDDLLQKCAERVAQKLGAESGGLAARTWGESVATRIRHPLSQALPGMGWLLDMPGAQLPGDSNMPRVQAASFGASERFAVEPGHEEYGYFHMPAGQSDNPLSPFYGAGHEDWAKGKASPFLPGPGKYLLTLNP